MHKFTHICLVFFTLGGSVLGAQGSCGVGVQAHSDDDSVLVERFAQAGLRLSWIRNLDELDLREFDPSSVILVKEPFVLEDKLLDGLESVLASEDNKEKAVNVRRWTRCAQFRPKTLPEDVFAPVSEQFRKVYSLESKPEGAGRFFFRGYFVFRATSDHNGGRVQWPHKHISDNVFFFVALRGKGFVILDDQEKAIYEVKPNEIVIFGGNVLHAGCSSNTVRLIVAAGFD